METHLMYHKYPNYNGNSYIINLIDTKHAKSLDIII